MLPFHRRQVQRHPDARHDQTEPPVASTDKVSGTGSKWQRLRRFAVDFAVISWKDILTIAILGAASLAVSHGHLDLF